MRYAIITCSTKLSILAPSQIFSGDIPFNDITDITGWLSLCSHVVNHAKRPAKPQPQLDIGREFDNILWSLIEECWSQEPSDRPTAANVSLRLGGVNACLVNPAEMYKKEIAALTEELARERERGKAARQDLEKRELEKVELMKDLDKERSLRKQVEKNADESGKAARQESQDFETELAALTEELVRERERSKAASQDLEKRELEKVELMKDLDKERYLRKQVEKNADESKAAARQYLETELANISKIRSSLNLLYPLITEFKDNKLIK